MDENDAANALDQPVNWIAVAVVQGMIQGEILVGRLRASGIPAWLSYESAGAAIGLTVGLLGRIEVMVPTDRHDEATELLFGTHNAPGSDEDILEDEDAARLEEDTDDDGDA